MRCGTPVFAVLLDLEKDPHCDAQRFSQCRIFLWIQERGSLHVTDIEGTRPGWKPSNRRQVGKTFLSSQVLISDSVKHYALLILNRIDDKPLSCLSSGQHLSVIPWHSTHEYFFWKALVFQFCNASHIFRFLISGTSQSHFYEKKRILRLVSEK